MEFTPRRDRRRVLIVTHGDGFAEAFAESDVVVRFARVPHCPEPTPPHRTELVAEEALELSLPKVWRDLFWPGKVPGDVRRAIEKLKIEPALTIDGRALYSVADVDRVGAFLSKPRTLRKQKKQ